MRLRILLFPAICILILGSCEKETDLTTQQMLDNDTPMSEIVAQKGLDSLYGKSYRGGLIAYMDTTTYQGFVVSTEDVSSTSNWGCLGLSSNFTTGDQIGDGAANQAAFLLHCTDPFSAVKSCQMYDVDGIMNWYLPSEQEMLTCFTNLHSKNMGNFSLDYYWTSTKGTLENTAQHVLFIDGSVSFSTVSNIHMTRAIRDI
ncbi:MAG: hypothetical protein BM555_02065 [Crocinitomix sp. MedPE-SWsnd]|nr:MAG: hypothetical protein BM555_02065 [Crocinitomix sp. MedPE-SWsnd]